MGQPKSPKKQVPPEDDPNSELNLLRREVRQLQAAVRDAALQIATHQEEAITLRKSLATAEVELEESLARESNLRLQLEAQRLKKEHIESTMAAAEALVNSLREMVIERDPPSNDSIAASPVRRSPQTASRADDLDLLLSRISDDADAPKPIDGPAEPTLVSTADVERPPDAYIFPTHHVHPRVRDLLADGIIGDTASPIESPLLSSQRPLDDTALADPTFLPPLRNPPSPPARHRHSMPVSRSPCPNPTQPGHPFNLLLSAFGTSTVSGTHQGHAIRSSSTHPGEDLPHEIATLAKGEETIRRSVLSLPSGIRNAVSDAHSGEIYSIASSADGKCIASAGDDKLVKVYDSTGAVVGNVSELARSATALAFTPDAHLQGTENSVIYAGSTDGSVRTFRKQPKRRTKWALASVYPVHTQTVRKIILTDSNGVAGGSPNLILSCSTDRTIKLSDVENGGRPYVVTTPSAVLDIDTFGPSGSGVFVSGHKDGGVRLWTKQEQNSNISSAKVHSKGVVSVSCLEDGYQVVTLGRDNVLRLCDIRKGVSVIREFEGAVDTVSDWHRAQAHDRYLACGLGRSGYLGVWSVDSGKLVRKLSSQVSNSNDDVLDMMTKTLRSPGCIIAPHWTASEQLVCAHRTRQISFWGST